MLIPIDPWLIFAFVAFVLSLGMLLLMLDIQASSAQKRGVWQDQNGGTH